MASVCLAAQITSEGMESLSDGLLLGLWHGSELLRAAKKRGRSSSVSDVLIGLIGNDPQLLGYRMQDNPKLMVRGASSVLERGLSCP